MQPADIPRRLTQSSAACAPPHNANRPTTDDARLWRPRLNVLQSRQQLPLPPARREGRSKFLCFSVTFTHFFVIALEFLLTFSLPAVASSSTFLRGVRVKMFVEPFGQYWTEMTRFLKH